MSKDLVIDYEAHYDRDYFTGQKTYRDAKGVEHKYHGPALEWEFFSTIADSFNRVFPVSGKKILDLGCSAGDFARRLMVNHGADAYGVEISDYAINNCVAEMRGRILKADITTCPDVFGNAFDLITCLDCVEHIYDEDWDKTFDWMLSKSKNIFLLIATASDANDVFVHKKGTPIPQNREGQAISGHIRVETPGFWLRYFKQKSIVVDWFKMYAFQMLREKHPAWLNTGGWRLANTWFLHKP
jgi:cyclopropane fatty-acyl-phospholipid synthase-like methyltransferase